MRQGKSTSPASFSVTVYSLKYKSCHNYRIKHEVLPEIKGHVVLTVNKFYKKLLSRSKHSRDTLQTSFLSFHSSLPLRWGFGATRQASPGSVNPENCTEAKIALLLIDRVFPRSHSCCPVSYPFVFSAPSPATAIPARWARGAEPSPRHYWSIAQSSEMAKLWYKATAADSWGQVRICVRTLGLLGHPSAHCMAINSPAHTAAGLWGCSIWVCLSWVWPLFSFPWMLPICTFCWLLYIGC